jgi:PRTRC genetic system protein B
MEVLSYMADGRDSEPVQALVLHKAGARHFALVHDITSDPATGGPMLTAGTPMTDASLRDLHGKLVGGGRTAPALIPAGVLLAEPGLLVWHRPSCRRTVFFATKDKALNAELDGRIALHPALLFVARPRRMAIYALPGNDRPALSTPLWRAPYYNLWLSGEMCEGDVYLPPDPLPNPECIASYERGFFDSSFVHTNVREKSQITTFQGGHDGLWRMLCQPGHGCFPTMFLVPSVVAGQRLTLEKVIAR